VLSNVILSGGCADFVGFKMRLFKQLIHDAKGERKRRNISDIISRIRVYSGYCPGFFFQWLGGSIVCSI